MLVAGASLPNMAKSRVLAYILWLVGGWCGLHHFYLRRDRHAFVWWCTLGGCCGLGWIRDLWRLGEYVDDVNEEPLYVEELTSRMRYQKKPAFNGTRLLGQIIIGMLFGYLAEGAIPEEWIETPDSNLSILIYISLPYIVALGVHLVGNIGRQEVSLKVTVAGAYVSLSCFWLKANVHIGCAAFFGALAANWKGKSWRRQPRKKRNVCCRFTVLVLCGLLYSTLWASVIYHNTYVTTKDGEQVKVREAVKHFFKSPAWAEKKNTMNQLWNYYQAHGWEKLWQEFVATLDPHGEANAYKVLNLTSSAPQEEITARYRKLARQWHPDRHRDEEKKKEAQERFMEIQQAYETLSNIKNKRKRSNNRLRGEDGDRSDL